MVVSADTRTSAPSTLAVTQAPACATLTAIASGGPVRRMVLVTGRSVDETVPKWSSGGSRVSAAVPRASAAASCTYLMSERDTSVRAWKAPRAAPRSDDPSRALSSATAPRRVNMLSLLRAASTSGGIGIGRNRRRWLRARYRSPSSSTSRPGVCFGLRSRTRS